MEEVKERVIGEIIQGLDGKKVAGVDGIKTIAFKKTWGYCKDEWLQMMNACLRTGDFPSEWRRSRVIWLLKPSGGTRPICLASSVAKVLDRVIA